MNIEFLNSGYFWLFLALPIIIYLFYKKQKSGFEFVFYKELKKIFKHNSFSFYLKFFLLIAIFINFILILANPQKANIEEKIKKNGIDIVFALDISGSMEAEDLKPNRIQAAKSVINNFINKLKTDRAGLVVFAGKPFVSIPLTFDYNILKENISRLSTENIDQSKSNLNGTAIGDAILMAKTLFKPKDKSKKEEYKKREKVIILLTDGDANTGVDPILAALSAKKQNIKIYTIGIGSKRGGIMTYNNGFFTQRVRIPPLKEKTLREIAKKTNGKFFRATDNKALEKIFDELSSLEKNDIEIKVKKEYKQYYNVFLYSLILLMFLFNFLMLDKLEIRKI